MGTFPEYGLISDEDLLSNLDRQSRLVIPNNDFISDDGDRQDASHRNLTPHSSMKISGAGVNSPFTLDDHALLQKLKDHSQLIEQLKSENAFLLGQISSKDH